MSKNETTSRVYLIAGIAIIVIIIMYTIVPKTDSPGYNPLNSNPRGIKALFLLLQEEGLKAERLAGVVPPAGGLVILVEPVAGKLTSTLADPLLDWVSQGNTLLVADEGPNILYRRFGDNPNRTQGQLGIRPVSSEDLLLKDVHELYFGGNARLDQQNSASATFFEYGDEQGIYLNKTSHGKGQIIFLTTPDLLANANIDQKDNLILFLNIVRLYGREGIWFSESVKSAPAAFTQKEKTASITPLYLSGIQFGLGILLLYYFWGKRFGRIIPIDKNGDSTALIEGDYVSSLAIIYRQARAGHLIFENIYQGFREDLARFSGVPQNTSNEKLLKIFSAWPGINAKKLGDLLAKGENLLSKPNFNENELLEITRELEIWRETNLGFRSKKG